VTGLDWEWGTWRFLSDSTGMIAHSFDDLNSPLQVVDNLATIAVNVPARPRIQYVGAFFDSGIAISVQVVSKGKVFVEVLVNPRDERGRDILNRLSKQNEVIIGFFPHLQPPLVRRELALLLERAETHVVMRPQWEQAAASYRAGE
jgi:hypothetical protein